MGIALLQIDMVKSIRKPAGSFKRHTAQEWDAGLVQLKNELRQQILNILRSQKKEDRLKKSKIIEEKLFAQKEFQKAKVILFYASFDGEVDTFEMMKRAQKLGKKIALPMILKEKRKIIPALVEDIDKLTQGAYGIYAPLKESSCVLKPQEIDLAIVPGVAFDKGRNRLGRGKGYYDRFLSQLPASVTTIGLAFDFQILSSLPCRQKHDMPLSKVIVN